MGKLTDNQDPVERLIAAWQQKSLSLKERVGLISKAFFESKLEFDGAVRILGCSAVELQATLSLAALSDSDLDKLSELAPAITTWYMFAAADEKGVEAGINALRKRKPGESSFMTVYNAVRESSGPDIFQRLGGLSSEVIGHLAHKAKEYDVLRPKDRSFLGSIARRRKANGELSQPQLEYFKSLVEQLIDKGVVSPSSKDKDQEICDAVLKAAGRF